MAMPRYQATGTPVADAVNDTMTATWPTHQVNDVGLLFVESTGGQTPTLSTPSGFVEVTNSPQATGVGTAGTRLAVYWCRATSSAQADVVIDLVGNHMYAVIVTFRGCIQSGNPWDVTAGSVKASASTTTTFDSVTTTVNNCLIVLAAAHDLDSASAQWSGWTNTALGALTDTEHQDAGTALGNGGGITVNSGEKGLAGATGSTTATVTSSINAEMTIALKGQPDTVFNNYQFVRVGDGMSTGERIR